MSRTRITSVALAAALAAAASGCAINFDARALGVSATMATPASQAVQGDTFAVTARAIHILWGAYPVKMPNLRSVLAGQITGGQGVANLRIRVRKTLPDIIVTALTLGIVSPTAITYEGVVTGAPAPAGGQ